MVEYFHRKLNDLYMLKLTFIPVLVLVVLTTACATKLSDVDYLNRTTEIYTTHLPTDGRLCDDDGVLMLLLFPRQSRYIYRGDISMMQEGAYTERNDSLFLTPSMSMAAVSCRLDSIYYEEYVYAGINDSTQSNVVTNPKIFIRLKDGNIAEIHRSYKFNIYQHNSKRYIPIPETIGNLDFHEFPQEVSDSIMATMTERHMIYQRVKLSK